MASKEKMSLKLLVDKKNQKVLFAEATKEFVDFLFHIFSMPLGTLIELIGSNQMAAGCLGKLKECIDNFNDIYLQPDITKDDIFNPKRPYNYHYNFLLFNDDSTTDKKSGTSTTVYMCPKATQNCYDCRTFCRPNVILYENSRCPSCDRAMSVEMSSLVPKGRKMEGGYVKEIVTYMVMDDLMIKPMSAISTISFIKNNIGGKDLSQLEEKTVTLESAEALKLLKASLMTDKVLTAVFL